MQNTFIQNICECIVKSNQKWIPIGLITAPFFSSVGVWKGQINDMENSKWKVGIIVEQQLRIIRIKY